MVGPSREELLAICRPHRKVAALDDTYAVGLPDSWFRCASCPGLLSVFDVLTEDPHPQVNRILTVLGRN
eukprot:5487178-Prymnesium_polylepis.1